MFFMPVFTARRARLTKLVVALEKRAAQSGELR
jgi:hypothetical protein